MRYEKPEIVHVADALATVQANFKMSPPHDLDIPSKTTVNAYEADE